MHFSCKIWHLVTPILLIFLRINWPQCMPWPDWGRVWPDWPLGSVTQGRRLTFTVGYSKIKPRVQLWLYVNVFRKSDLWQDSNDAILLFFCKNRYFLSYKCVSIQNSTWILLRSAVCYCNMLRRLRQTTKHDMLSIQTRFRQSVTVMGTHLAFKYWVQGFFSVQLCTDCAVVKNFVQL